MQEKVLSSKKNGMAMMILFILLYAAAAGLTVIGSIFFLVPAMVIGIIWLSLGWIPFLGLRVLKPQEALVLTLFGKYVGTLKDDGFYWVNPFCTAVNPAAKTKLNQSGDVDGGAAAIEMELHPCFQQPELFDYCKAHGIEVVGFCPIGSPERPERDKMPEDIADIQ